MNRYSFKDTSASAEAWEPHMEQRRDLNALRRQAEQGDFEAQYEWGRCLAYGKGVAKDAGAAAE